MSVEEPKAKHLTPREWAEIEELWMLGDITLNELGERYGVNPSYLSRKLAERGIKKGSKKGEAIERVREAVAAQQAEKTAETLRKIEETKKEHYEYARTLGKLAFTLVAQRVKAGQPISLAKDDIRTVKEAMIALQIARNERWAILGLDKDDTQGEELTQLVIHEMTREEIEELRAHQRAQRLEDDIDEIDRLVESMGDEPPSVS